jgi:hypothetical protein
VRYQVVTKIVEKIVRVPVPVPVPVAGGGGMGDFRYWERTTALHDVFPRPTDTSQEKFVSFEPWNGGFNNIRQVRASGLQAGCIPACSRAKGWSLRL